MVSCGNISAVSSVLQRFTLAFFKKPETKLLRHTNYPVVGRGEPSSDLTWCLVRYVEVLYRVQLGTFYMSFYMFIFQARNLPLVTSLSRSSVSNKDPLFAYAVSVMAEFGFRKYVYVCHESVCLS